MVKKNVQLADDGEIGWLQRLKHSKLYPLYFLIRSPLLIPQLIANEGISGALRWLSMRLFLLFARVVDQRKDFYEQPIRTFRSRLGFSLVRRVEFLVYDEIFLDHCYAFNGFAQLVQESRPLRALDFGTHHGLFIDYLRILNPQAEVYGAELNPESFAVAKQRFSGQPLVHIDHVAIGGSHRRLKVGICNVSVEQSIYLEQKENGFEVELVTPMQFIQRQNLQARDIHLVKMDIEGAEREVFSNLDSIKPILEAIQAFVVEIHSPVDVSVIENICATTGLSLVEKRGINYFFRR